MSGETGDNCIVLYAGTNGTHKLEEVEAVLEHFEPGDWIIQQNEINLGGEIMKMAAKKGKLGKYKCIKIYANAMYRPQSML